jgi:hypothetical protein
VTCQRCASKSQTFDFNKRCCLVRWLRYAHPEHAKSWLARYQKKHGRPAMLELIAEVKADG